MGVELDLDHVAGDAAALAIDAGEHQVGVGVFVVDPQQAAVRRARTGRQRHEGDVVVVVAELGRLRGRRLHGGIEGGRAARDRVAPPDQHVGAVAFGDVMAFVGAMDDFLEA